MRRVLIVVRDADAVRRELRRLRELEGAVAGSLTDRTIQVLHHPKDVTEYRVAYPYTVMKGTPRLDEVVIDSVILAGNTWRSSEQFREWVVNDVGTRMVSEESVVRWR